MTKAKIQEPEFSVPSTSLSWIIDPKTGNNNILVNGHCVKTFTIEEGYEASQFVAEYYADTPCVLRFGEDGNGFVMQLSRAPLIYPDDGVPRVYYNIETVIHSYSEKRKRGFWFRPVMFPRWFAVIWLLLCTVAAGLSFMTLMEIGKTCSLSWPSW